MALALSLSAWAPIAVGKGIVLGDIELGVLYMLGISSMGVYAVLLSGWASNNRYGYIGGIRAMAQMVSYELSIGIIMIAIILSAGTMNIMGIGESQRI